MNFLFFQFLAIFQFRQSSPLRPPFERRLLEILNYAIQTLNFREALLLRLLTELSSP